MPASRATVLATAARAIPVVTASSPAVTPFLTPMPRGPLPTCCCRDPDVDGLQRPRGRNASARGTTPSTITSPTRHTGSRTEISRVPARTALAPTDMEAHEAPARDEIQAPTRRAIGPRSLLHLRTCGRNAVAAALHVAPGPHGTLSDDDGLVHTGDLSRVRRDDAGQIRSIVVRSRPCERRRKNCRASTVLWPHRVADEMPANTAFCDGRGWFRTSVLSRVKHGVRRPSERRNTCKSGQSLRPVSAGRWASYGPIRLGLAQRMAQRPGSRGISEDGASPRGRHAL
jgi:hypothetical protein